MVPKLFLQKWFQLVYSSNPRHLPGFQRENSEPIQGLRITFFGLTQLSPFLPGSSHHRPLCLGPSFSSACS